MPTRSETAICFRAPPPGGEPHKESLSGGTSGCMGNSWKEDGPGLSVDEQRTSRAKPLLSRGFLHAGIQN